MVVQQTSSILQETWNGVKIPRGTDVIVLVDSEVRIVLFTY